MTYKDLDLEDSYDSDTNDLINDFYIPVLSQSKEYYRAVGYFNSKSLSFAAQGIKNFILNRGKLKIVCGTQLSKEDVKSIIKAEKTPEEVLTHNFLEDINNLEDEIRNNYVNILGWMIANDLLEIKVAIKLDDDKNPTFGEEGILHIKVGIFKDSEGNLLSINGSNNETPFGWGKNYENFEVFPSWNPHDFKRLNNHIKLFNKVWNGKLKDYKVMPVPDAVKDDLISRSPPSFDGLKFPEDKKHRKQNKNIILYDYQTEAREKWFKNNKKGIFSMATGTGKTFTALGCLEKVLKENDNLVVIITAPKMHLVQQWKDSISSFSLLDKFDEVIIVDSSNPKGKKQFQEAVFNIDLGLMENVLILTTHNSLSSEKFYDFLLEDDFDCKFMLIGDEMHGLGSHNFKKGLLSQYEFRLGLSATPIRHYDEEGTDFLYSYFGNEVYKFPLEKALVEINPATNLTYLTPYNYHPYFLELAPSELADFNNLSHQIVIETNKEEPNLKKLSNLKFKRANILKSARGKMNLLRDILNDMDERNRLLVYCNEKQIDDVVKILGNEYKLNVKRFTSEQGMKPLDKFGGLSEKEFILKNFAKGNYDCIVAMHCLDEGMDVPSATRAILMCNSTNPREFIQRVGRVIRRFDDKNEAEIYDMLIKPSKRNSKFKDIEENIFNRELDRSDLIGELALNNAEYFTLVNKNR